jgi:hypothetical protein
MSFKDIEYGPIMLSKRMKQCVEYYKKNNKKIKYFCIGFLILTLALIIKLGLNNVDSVIETATAITLDEAVYKPFKWSETIIPDVEFKSVKKFPIKESHVNWKMQSLNIIQAREHVIDYLKQGGYICIHMRHFSVPYDIIVFNNITMVNPLVESESDTYHYVNEESLTGVTSRKKRPDTVNIVYHDEGLNRQFITLYDNQASCFAHYSFN